MRRSGGFVVAQSFCAGEAERRPRRGLGVALMRGWGERGFAGRFKEGPEIWERGMVGDHRRSRPEFRRGRLRALWRRKEELTSGPGLAARGEGRRRRGGKRGADKWGRAVGAGDASWAGRARLRWLSSGAGGSVADGGRRRASGKLGRWQVGQGRSVGAGARQAGLLARGRKRPPRRLGRRRGLGCLGLGSGKREGG